MSVNIHPNSANMDNKHSMETSLGEDISLNIPNKITDSHKTKIEESWNSEHEGYMRSIIDTCSKKIKQHDRAGYHFKKLHDRWALPAMIVPICMTAVSSLISTEVPETKYVNAIAFALSGILNAIVGFYQYNEKKANNFNDSAKYNDVIIEIESELEKGRPYRTQYDVFSTKVKMIVSNLCRNESLLPEFIANSDEYL